MILMSSIFVHLDIAFYFSVIINNEMVNNKDK